MLRSTGNSPSSPLWKKKRLRWEGFAEKEGCEGVMDDESGESMEEEVPLAGTGELESGRLVWGWRREAGSWFQRRGEVWC